MSGHPDLHRESYAPHAQMLSNYTMPRLKFDKIYVIVQNLSDFYFGLESFLMHWAQAKTRLPLARRVHCKFGYFLFFGVGLYLPRSFFLAALIIEPLPQIAHFFIPIDYIL